jgi:hypothetical protein
LETIDVSLWLPRFIRVAQVICSHLSLDPSDVVGTEVMKQGRALVDEEDKKLAHAVATRIAAAKAFAEHLLDKEVQERHLAGLASRQSADKVVPCPACGQDVALDLEPIRRTNERLEDDEIRYDIISVARGLECPVCDLTLSTTAEVSAAGLPQQYTRTEVESFEDRHLEYYEPDDYGND